METLFIGIGSNIDPEENLRTAAALLRTYFPDAVFSSVYRSAPQLLTEQPAFLNAVMRAETDHNPAEVHAILQTIEKTLKKNPPMRYGPRTIDLDLLLYSDHIAEESNLTIPHPHMHERRFVLEPLCELLDPEELHPVSGTSWSDLLASTTQQDVERVPLELS